MPISNLPKARNANNSLPKNQQTPCITSFISMKAPTFLALWFLSVFLRLDAADKPLDSALRSINTTLDSMSAISPFDERFETIDSLNASIEAGLAHWLNQPDFDIFSYKHLLSSFNFSTSPDSAVWTINWYLNNGGSWVMQYSGYYFQKKDKHLFLKDTESPFEQGTDITEGTSFQPFSGLSTMDIHLIPGKKPIYIVNSFAQTCNSCGVFQLQAFAIDENGYPVPANIIDSSANIRLECRLNGTNHLEYDAKKKRIYMEVVCDDITAQYGWFKLEDDGDCPPINHLKTTFTLKKRMFKQERSIMDHLEN